MNFLLLVYAPNLGMTNDELMKIIVDSAFKVHKELGPGMLESIYEQALSILLRKQGLTQVISNLAY